MEVLNVIVRGGWVFDDLKLYTYNNGKRVRLVKNIYLQLWATYCLLMPTWHAFLSKFEFTSFFLKHNKYSCHDIVQCKYHEIRKLNLFRYSLVWYINHILKFIYLMEEIEIWVQNTNIYSLIKNHIINKIKNHSYIILLQCLQWCK